MSFLWTPGALRIHRELCAVGFWPASLITCLQLGFFLEFPETIPAITLLVTFLGTCGVYILDRFLEKSAGHVLEERHELNRGVALSIIALLIPALVAFMAQAVAGDWIWLTGLCCGGLIYLLLTSGWLPSFLFFKELLGAALFTFLVLGRIRTPFLIPIGFYFLAMGNFLWSGYYDQTRDRQNTIESVAGWNPKTAILLARVFSLLSCFSWMYALPAGSHFGTTLLIVSALQALWPLRTKKNDIVFLPLALWVILEACHYLLNPFIGR